MLKKCQLLVILFLISFSGCSSKNYFTPKKIDSSLTYKYDLKSSIKSLSRDGVTYEDGKVVTKSRGLLKIKIPKGFHFIYDDKSRILISDDAGEVEIINNSAKVVFKKRFDTALSSGSLHGNIAAFVFSNNKISLYDLKRDKELYKEELEPTFAQDSRVANPIFINDLVVFPTLDGRLLVMDRNRYIILRDIALSNKELFNNVIFLKSINNNIIAATAYKVIAINPSTIHTKRVDVKDIIYTPSNVYIFTKNGKVLKCDLNLNILKERKFDFAIFSAVAVNNYLYIVEKGGYLIKMDKDLENLQILKLPNEIKKPVFAFKNKLFIDHYYIELQ